MLQFAGSSLSPFTSDNFSNFVAAFQAFQKAGQGHNNFPSQTTLHAQQHFTQSPSDSVEQDLYDVLQARTQNINQATQQHQAATPTQLPPSNVNQLLNQSHQ